MIRINEEIDKDELIFEKCKVRVKSVMFKDEVKIYGKLGVFVLKYFYM